MSRTSPTPMPLSEFDVIKTYFAQTQSRAESHSGVKLGIGDDCAIVSLPTGHDLVMTVDTLVEGVHFSPLFSPQQVGWFSLAVSLSDLAAMGAKPTWFTLAITSPELDSDWFAGFSRGLFECAELHGITLVGGDTTQGVRTISIQAHGSVPQDQAIRRDGAMPGDLLFVTGKLGAARAGLEILLEEQQTADSLTQRLIHPSPRVKFGQHLRGLANAAIDISDGLAADLGHILERSQVGARVSVAALPLDDLAVQRFGGAKAREFALYGGDDYELCFSLPPANRAAVENAARNCDVEITQIGEAIAGNELLLEGENIQIEPAKRRGYQHFQSPHQD